MSNATERLKALLAAKAGKATGADSNASKQLPGPSRTPAAQPASPASNVPSVPEAPETTEEGVLQTVVSTDCSPEYLPFKEKLMQLEEALEKSRPGFAYMLRDIHQAMQKQADVVTIMTDKEIGLVVSGLVKMKGTVLGTETKSTGGRKKRTTVITSDMI